MKRLASILALSLIAASPAKKVPSSTPVLLSQFDRAVAQAVAELNNPRDDFYTPPKAEAGFDGTPFKIVKQISKQEGATAYSYKEGVLLLLVGAHNLNTMTNKNKVEMLLISINRILGDSYNAQNAYGAQVKVITETNIRKHLLLVSMPQGMPNPYFKPNQYQTKSPYDDYDSYWLKLPLNSDAAKTVMLDTDVVLEGNYAALGQGQSAVCMTETDKPTFNAPLKSTNITCGVGAHLQRIAFIRRSTGEVLGEWKQ